MREEDQKALILQDIPREDQELTNIAALVADGQLPVERLRAVIEMAYRRGFVQGAAVIKRAAEQECHVDIMQAYVNSMHLKWRCNLDEVYSGTVTHPPEVKEWLFTKDSEK